MAHKSDKKLNKKLNNKLNNKFDNNLLYFITKAILLCSNSLSLQDMSLSKIYRASTCYVFKILAIVYCEKHRNLQSVKLIDTVFSDIKEYENNLFNKILDYQIKSLRLNEGDNNLFASGLKENVSVKEKYFAEFIESLKNIVKSINLNIESLGYIYENLQQYKLVQNIPPIEDSLQLKLNLERDDYDYILIKSNESRKKQGIFFTPARLINQLLESSLLPRLEEVESLEELLEIKILDPACGGGNILIGVFNCLYDKALSLPDNVIHPEELKKLILKQCIYGIDLDPVACEIAKLSLFLLTGKTDHFKNVLNANYLIESLESYEYNLDLNRLFNDSVHKFDLIIGNPPYINIQYLKEEEKAYYLEFYSSAFRRFDIYVLFFEKSLKYLLKDNGLLAFIVPDKFLTQSYAQKIRKLILDNYSIKKIVSYKEQLVFKNAVVEPIIIVINSKKEENPYVETVEIKQNLEKENFLNQSNFLNMYNFGFRVSWNIFKQEIIETVQNKSFPLSEMCYISWGAQPGNASKFIFKNLDLVPEQLHQHAKPLIKGKNLDKYQVSYSGDYLLYVTEGENKLHRPAFKELFESEKVVISEVTKDKGIIAALDNQKYYTNHSIINCIHKRDLFKLPSEMLTSRGIRVTDNLINKYKWLDNENAYTKKTSISKGSKFNNITLKYILGILNSNVINFYFKNFLSGDLNVFPELVRFLPIFDITVQPFDIFDSMEFIEFLSYQDYESAKRYLVKTIQQENYWKAHQLITIVVEIMVSLKSELKMQEFVEFNSILNSAVCSLYGLNKEQVAYINEYLI